MAREENSLIFSLKEVAKTLQDRLQEEEDAKTAADQAERRRIADAAQRKRDEEEAKIRAAEDAARREQEERDRLEREARIHLEESERRARIEAQARIDEAQIRAATEAIRNKPLPVRLIAAVSAVLILFSILVVSQVRKAQEQTRKDNFARAKAQIEAERRKERDEQDRLQKALTDRTNEMTRLEEAVASAKSQSEKIDLINKARTAAAAAARASADAAAGRKAASEAEKKRKLERCKNADDPLCGL